jgi:LmbE family N-acetylglucosaminyl deacetylase
MPSDDARHSAFPSERSALSPSPYPSYLEAAPHVLLVDDDVEFVALATEWLTSRGYTVTAVDSGEAAVERLAWLPSIDCLVCDTLPNGMTGFEVLRTSKVVRPLLPVLIVAPDDSREVPVLALRNGADDLITKPVSADEFVERVKELVISGRIARVAGSKTVVAIGAHPDDAEIGIGGTLLQHVAKGDRVVHLVMTDGEIGGPREERVAEAECAADQMGVTLRRASLPDGKLSDTRETVEAIEAVIQEFHPALVYVHSNHDTHQDHRATHHASLVAARGIPHVYAYQSPSSTVDFRPTRFVDVASYLDRKVDLINVFRSQARIRLYLADDMIRSTARYWGRHAGHRIVEPLEVLRQLSA